MGLTTDPTDPALRETVPGGQQKAYLVLTEEERAKGFVRPLRRSYRHVGVRPKYPLRDLTGEEKERFKDIGYTHFELYPEHSPEGLEGKSGRYWMKSQLKSGCGATTTMGLALCETYACKPNFYGATFCCRCGTHLPVGEFVWTEDDTVVGS